MFRQDWTDATLSMSDSDEKVWQTTAVQNLVRYVPSGTYFARFRVVGKLVWKSLKTATFSVAKQRLRDTLRDHRSKIESFTAFTEGKMTVGNAADVYLQKVRASISLKPSIRRSWPSLSETDVRKVSPRDCELWLSRYQQRYSPSVINNTIGTLRAIFDEAHHASRSPPPFRHDLHRKRRGHSYCFALARSQRHRPFVHENVLRGEVCAVRRLACRQPRPRKEFNRASETSRSFGETHRSRAMIHYSRC